ncbi:MAG: alpha/beta hydrolase [Dehalococcoidia bacterium]
MAPISIDPDHRHEVRVSDVEYRRDGDVAWLATVYRPAGAGPFAALLNVHGGAWNTGSRADNAALSQGLAAAGAVVASIDFRMGGDHPYPSSLIDINYATRWLKAHAADFAADPASVGALGVSSGGHLALLSGMRPHDTRYAALPLPEAGAADATLAYVISCWGVLDPYARYQFAQQIGRTELIASHDRYFGSIETMQEANPLLIVERGEPATLPPALLIQGTADAILPPGMVERVADAYRAAGGAVDLALFEGMPHGITGWPESEVARMVARMAGFINRCLAPVAAA